MSEDQTLFILIDYWSNQFTSLHLYDKETMDTISISLENFVFQQARFTNDENTIIFSGEGITGKELYSYSILDNSISLIGDSLSNYFNNLEISPDGQKVLYFRQSQFQPEGVSGCDLPENTLYLTEMQGYTGSYTGEIFYNSTSNIGEFQFGIMGPPSVSSATGGDAEDAGFTIEFSNGNSVLGSSTGLAIPAGCGTLTNISRANNAIGLNNIIILDSNGDTLDFTYYDGYLNTLDYSRNIDVITKDLQSGETSILTIISQLINPGDDFAPSQIYNQPYWSDNGFIYLFFFDDSECTELFKIDSESGSITQLTDNPCSRHYPSSFLETNESDLEKLIYAVQRDSLLDDEYWIYDINSNESSYIGYFGPYFYYWSHPMSQTWSPDQSKVAFNEMWISSYTVNSPGPLRVYDTGTDSLSTLVLYNGWSSSLAPSQIVWVEDSIEHNDVSWDFSVSEPSIQISGDDNEWNPGESLQIEMDFCNNSDIDHSWYPGLVLESDTNLVSISYDHFWFYGMSADSCNIVPFYIFADSTINFDTLVTFIAYAEALNCQNQPEYCIFGDTLTFQVQIFGESILSAQKSFIPLEFSLHQNYPNPFNPITSLRYDLPEDGLVNITIYDMMGRLVKTLVNGSQTVGFKSVKWNATNDRNEPVSAGLYLYTIQAGEFRQTKKMVLLK